jgi:hypothetical protein
MTTSRRPRRLDEDPVELADGDRTRASVPRTARGSSARRWAPSPAPDTVDEGDAGTDHADVEDGAYVSPYDSAEDDGTGQGSAPGDSAPAPKKAAKKPLYPRLLRLQHIQPNAWQRAALGEGAIGVGVLLSMADLATAWSIVVIPVAVAGIVKAHDALQGLIDRGGDPPPPAA